MGRRLATVMLACAATVAAVPAGAQVPSTTLPGSQVGTSTTISPSSSVPATPATSAVPPTTSAVPPAGVVPPPTSSTPATSAVPGGASSTTSGPAKDTPSQAVVLLTLVGLALLLAAALWGAARWWAWEPTWWIRSRHATAEAGWRTSAAWAEFRDWLRLGR